MKYKYLFLIPIVFIACMLDSYGQIKNKIRNDSIIILKSGMMWKDSVIAKRDSSRYWFTQYIRLKNRGIKDSVNKYYFKLLKK